MKMENKNGQIGIGVILFLFIFLLIETMFIGWVARDQRDYRAEQKTMFEPERIINLNQIKQTTNYIKINEKDLVLTQYADTKSMYPTLDSNCYGLNKKVTHYNQLEEGNIISYTRDNITIVHRIIKIGEDNLGWYAITKGDNAKTNDGKIRFKQVKHKLVALIY
jgi:hypothetical protein